MKTARYFSVLAALSLALSVAIHTSGCGSTRKTSTTTVTTEEAPESTAPPAATSQPATKVVTEKSETVTEKESSGPWCGGILSCSFEGIGWVLALPFRLAGGVIDVIF